VKATKGKKEDKKEDAEADNESSDDEELVGMIFCKFKNLLTIERIIMYHISWLGRRLRCLRDMKLRVMTYEDFL
jgi:hypothetical protein